MCCRDSTWVLRTVKAFHVQCQVNLALRPIQRAAQPRFTHLCLLAAASVALLGGDSSHSRPLGDRWHPLSCICMKRVSTALLAGSLGWSSAAFKFPSVFPRPGAGVVPETLGRPTWRESPQGQLNVAAGFMTTHLYQLGLRERAGQPELPLWGQAQPLPEAPWSSPPHTPSVHHHHKARCPMWRVH